MRIYKFPNSTSSEVKVFRLATPRLSVSAHITPKPPFLVEYSLLPLTYVHNAKASTHLSLLPKPDTHDPSLTSLTSLMATILTLHIFHIVLWLCAL